MIREEAVLNFLEVRVQDKDTLTWSSIAAEATTLSITRGGKQNYGGITSVDAGIVNIRLKNLYDPAVIDTITPQMKIQIYNTTFDTPDNGSIFLGVVDDIDSEYILNKATAEVDIYVNILASDAVATHNNITRNGVRTDDGFQRWEERIESLETSAVTEIVIPDVNADVLIYSI
jgi:hypothetical protein